MSPSHGLFLFARDLRQPAEAAKFHKKTIREATIV